MIGVVALLGGWLMVAAMATLVVPYNDCNGHNGVVTTCAAFFVLFDIWGLLPLQGVLRVRRQKNALSVLR